MLRGNYNCVNADRLAVVVLNCHLRLAVGTEIAQSAVLSHLCETESELVSERDRERHKLGSLIAREAEHNALISSAVGQTVAVAVLLAVLECLVNTHSDVGRLLVDRSEHRAGVSVKAVLGSVVADICDDLTCDSGDIYPRLCGYLTDAEHHTRSYHSLARNARVLVLLKHSVEDGVGYLVAYFIGVTLSYRFRSEKDLTHIYSSKK